MLFSAEPHIQHQQDSSLRIIKWISEDQVRMEALKLVSKLNLPDWCLAAGFVRNLVWDKLHDYTVSTKLSDIDLIYFDPINDSAVKDLEIEEYLKSRSNLPWSVKNQARMHIKNGDQPYRSTSDAMRYWVEVETAIGVKLSIDGEIELIAPFGLEALMANTITMNNRRPKPDIFKQRISSKKWLEQWPKLRVCS